MAAGEQEHLHRRARLIVLVLVALLTAGIFIKYIVDERNHKFRMNSLIATMVSQQNSSGFIVVSGNQSDRETQIIVELLKIYGFTPSLELGEDPNVPIPTEVILSRDIKIRPAELLTLFHRMKMAEFHPGYKKEVPVLYGTIDSNVARKMHELLESTGKHYIYIDMRGEDPANDGLRARLYISGYLPYEELNNEVGGPFLEYENRMYPYPDMVAVIKTLK